MIAAVELCAGSIAAKQGRGARTTTCTRGWSAAARHRDVSSGATRATTGGGTRSSVRLAGTADRGDDDARLAVDAIEELHAQLPFSRELWGTFMGVYWQKKPVVIRGAVRAGSSAAVAIDADELAGLACEAEFQPRIIHKGEGGAADWALELGPFSEAKLQSLPSAGGSWCLLLNDLEKHVPEAAELLNLFDHFPRWRVADVQASISTDGGSVGAHSDQFDVFLIQADGCKRWAISESPEYAPDNEDAFFADIDVNVLKDFQPQACSVLRPGDVLYLPPKVAHHGVAELCDTVCTTYSVGFLAPPHDDLVLSYAQASVDGRDDAGRWSDPWLEPQDDVGSISPDAVTHAAEIIRRSMPKNEADIARWFGCHVTASYGSFDGVPEKEMSPEDLLARWTEEGSLLRRADVKFAFSQDVNDGSLEGCFFFAGGNAWVLKSQRGIELARHIANHDEIEAEDWVERTDATEYEMESESETLVSDLFNRGFIEFIC
jgi:50S ribosomal protein L16 3-hydroxylase